MNSATVLERLERERIIPVVVIDDAAVALDVVDALAAGGIRCAEITLRTRAALSALELSAAVADFVVGAGTVLRAEDVERCASAGARFIVSPGFDEEVVARAQSLGLAVLPGVATASEIQSALRAGIDVMKFFPAHRLGGLATIGAFSGPFRDVRFVPSGGVNQANAREYLSHPSVFAVSGSWMVPRTAIASGDTETIAGLSREATEYILRA